MSSCCHPKGEVNPFTIELLKQSKISVEGLRSKSWDEFAQPGAPPLDFVFTVCDQAAGEQCPYWPGQPMTAHWGMPDPAAVEGTHEQKLHAFADTFQVLRRRIELLASLPFDKLDRLALQERVSGIAKQWTSRDARRPGSSAPRCCSPLSSAPGSFGERLAEGKTSIALLANALATGGGLVALILTFGLISGAQFNPVVTLSLAASRLFPWREVSACGTPSLVLSGYISVSLRTARLKPTAPRSSTHFEQQVQVGLFQTSMVALPLSVFGATRPASGWRRAKAD